MSETREPYGKRPMDIPIDLEYSFCPGKTPTPTLEALEQQIIELEQKAQLLTQQMTQMDDLIAMLQAEGRSLVEENKALRAALEHYAAHDNWDAVAPNYGKDVFAMCIHDGWELAETALGGTMKGVAFHVERLEQLGLVETPRLNGVLRRMAHRARMVAKRRLAR